MLVREFPQVDLVNGSGQLFWARGMKLAEKIALRSNVVADYILLLNDDVGLFPELLEEMIEEAYLRNCSFIGQVIDPISKKISYGGLLKEGVHPLRFELKDFGDVIWKPDVFHANVALIRIEDYLKVGGLDEEFQHAYADFDLALRLRDIEAQVYVFNRIVGTCEANINSFSGNRLELLKFLSSNKGRPWRSQYKFIKRHSGSRVIASLFTLSPYVKGAILGK
jgi:GT2 family glycosyltransferase